MSRCKLYFSGKYARRIKRRISLNLSNPNPIITVENVPPKTIISGGIKNNALKLPPSKKKAPKIEDIPNINPPTVLNFFIINNLRAFYC